MKETSIYFINCYLEQTIKQNVSNNWYVYDLSICHMVEFTFIPYTDELASAEISVFVGWGKKKICGNWTLWLKQNSTCKTIRRLYFVEQ